MIEVGDRWSYRGINILGPALEEYTIEVASVHDQLIQVVCTRKRDGKEFDGTYTSEWAESSPCSGLIRRPPARVLRFPLVVGNSHSLSYVIHRARSFKYTNKVDANVVVKGWESIEVPAGRFNALDVEVTMTVLQPDGSSVLRTLNIWYSPEVRRWVRYKSTAPRGDTFEEELLSFKLAD